MSTRAKTGFFSPFVYKTDQCEHGVFKKPCFDDKKSKRDMLTIYFAKKD